MLVAVFAQVWLDAIPDPIEIILWSVVGAGALIGGLRIIWGWGPVSWVRDNIAEDIEKRVQRVNAAANAEQLAQVQTYVDTKIDPLQASIDTVIGLAKATDRDLKQHMVDSANQHQSDLDERIERQKDRDERDRDVDTMIAGILTRLQALEPSKG